MSEIDEFRNELSKMTLDGLKSELQVAYDQQANAGGEYGYWGGVTRQEMVEAELQNRLDEIIALTSPQKVKRRAQYFIDVKKAEDNLQKVKSSK